MAFLRSFLLFFYCFCYYFSFDAQGQLWRPISKNDFNAEQVKHFQKVGTYQLNRALILDKIPLGKDSDSKQNKPTIKLPTPEGHILDFELINTPIIPPKIQHKIPVLQAFKVTAKERLNTHGRIAWTTKGLYGHILENGISYFIEQTKIPDLYFVYRQTDYLPQKSQHHFCGSIDVQQTEKTEPRTIRTNDTALKVFRLAVTATPSFTNAVGGTVEDALSTVVNTITSLNVIYERDLGIQFVLHEENEKLIFTEAHPVPFPDTANAFDFWAQNGTLLDSIIGNNSYDLGHVFSADCVGGVAGLAQLTGVCSAEKKANGVSCIFGENKVDFRKTFYHEIGHQLGANHTWSNCGQDANEFQRHPPTAVEPGSGNTIMSYGGLCGPFNTTTSSSDYLHGISILEIQQALSVDSTSCFQKIPNQNIAPEVTVRGSGFYIPIGTPFELAANVFDEDSTSVTYNWEQLDTGTISVLGVPKGSSPSFVSFRPSKESIRIFPRATVTILNNTSPFEVLPDTTRPLTFGVTVRDNHPEGGSTAFDKVSFTATEEAGPFTIIRPDSAEIEFAPNDSMEITWDVANTDTFPINCQAVDIYISYNNGVDFSIKLASAVPNNGRTKVQLPSITTNRARIKVKCTDNIFFDISDYRIKIQERIISSTKNIYKETIQLYPNPTREKLNIEFGERLTKPTTFTIFDVHGRAILEEKVPLYRKFHQVDIQALPNGVYQLQGIVGEQFFSKPFIVQK